MKRILILLIAFVLILSCSKDDASSTPIITTRGEVFKSQVVTINFPDNNLSQNEYQATLGGIAITLSKSEANKLVFLVPYSTPTGLADLVIPAINNTTIQYEIKESVLGATPEAILTVFSNNLETFSATLDASPESLAIQNSINSFNNYCANATEAEKMEMAVLYKTNKAQFDKIMLYDFSDVTGRPAVTTSDVILIAKHSLACVFVAGGAVAVLYGDPATKFAGAVIAMVAFKRAMDFHKELVTRNLNTIGLVVESIMGTNNRGVSSALVFQSNVSRTMPLNTSNRALIASDSNKTQAAAVSYFQDYNLYNLFAGRVNIALQWLNDHIIFADFSLIPLEQLPTSSVAANVPTNAAIFNNITFAVNNPNLTLVSAVLQSDGQMTMKIKITGTPTLPVSSTLNYTYSDSFSSFSGTLPIMVDNTNYAIGSPYQGGIIAYVFQPVDPGYIAGQTHGLIASAQDIGSVMSDCQTYYPNMQPTSAALGSGQQNTTYLSQFCTGATNAVHLCDDLDLNGYTDWYLPSKDELNKLYLNRIAIGGFFIGPTGNPNAFECSNAPSSNCTLYWTSTYMGAGQSYAINFESGYAFSYDTTYVYNTVRAVRSF